MLGTLYRWAFYAFIIWVPIPLGSNRPVFWAINALACAVIFALLVVDEVLHRRRDRPGRKMLAVLLLLGSVPVLWMLVQASSWTPAFLHADQWSALAGSGIAAAGRISINPGATFVTASEFMTVVLAGVIAFRIATNGKRSSTLVYVLLLSSGIVAGWGLLSLALGLKPQFVAAGNTSTQGYLASFFVNRNTAATSISIGLVIAVSLLMARIEHDAQRAVGFAAALIDFPRRAGLPLALVGFFAVALVATESRAGVAAGALGAMGAYLLSIRRGSRGIQLAVGAVVVLAAGALLFFGAASESLFGRLSTGDLATDSRWPLYRATLQAIGDRPILGFGGGTFADLFPAYHSPALTSEAVWLQAHNSYLQAMAELGVPAFLWIGVALVALAAGAVIAVRRRDAPMPGTIAAVAALVVVAVHSLFDFSLQIEGVALPFAALLGAGLAGPVRARITKSKESHRIVVERRYESFSVIPEVPS